VDTTVSLEFRTITEAEVEPWIRALAAGFNAPSIAKDVELRRSGMDLSRCHAALDGDSVVGTARAVPTPLTVPGGNTVAAGAVTNVAVAPTHRRRGALTGMMTAQLDDIAARGEPVAILIAAEAPIYGRFGYGAATVRVAYRLSRSAARLAVRPPSADRVRLVDNDELRRVGPAIYDRYRLEQPGAIGRDDRWWDFFTGVLKSEGDDSAAKRFHAVFGDDGWVSYSVEEHWESSGTPSAKASVSEFVAATPAAYAALWWFVLQLDWIGTIEIGERPPAEPVAHLLTDRRRLERTETWDFVWVRLLDVETALTARTYEVDDRLALRLVDAFRPQTDGVYVLDVHDGVAKCTRDDGAAPDLALDVGHAGAAYLGASTLHLAADAGLVDERTPGAVLRFDRLFGTARAPWCNTWF
jgi:predicted acetyltransferase